MTSYSSFLKQKQQMGTDYGFSPSRLPSKLFGFQEALCEWAIRKGRAAIFADCGLGKTAMQLTFAENVLRRTNKAVLVLTPLAVGSQTVSEGEKFGIECALVKRNKMLAKQINVTNYHKLHHFSSNDFAGIILDESAILKSFDGEYRSRITEFMRRVPYRLLCSATPAPNDYVELGTSSEALGYLGYVDMLGRFFKNNQGNSVNPFRRFGGREPDDGAKWRFKGHAEEPFWRWVCSWARAIRKPSDMGFKDDGFILPKLIERQHLIEATRKPERGTFFALPAYGLKEQRQERWQTLSQRCDKAAALINGRASVVWCELNAEGEALHRLIPDSVEVSGKDGDDEKEAKLNGFIEGRYLVLITKAKIGGWGLNFQHCAHSISFPTHSYEAYYQTIRRCWRYGQKRNVISDIVSTVGEVNVLSNLQRKALAADRMFGELVRHMNHSLSVETEEVVNQGDLPSWL